MCRSGGRLGYIGSECCVCRRFVRATEALLAALLAVGYGGRLVCCPWLSQRCAGSGSTKHQAAPGHMLP